MLNKLNSLYDNLLELETIMDTCAKDHQLSLKLREMESAITELMGEQIKIIEKRSYIEVMPYRQKKELDFIR